MDFRPATSLAAETLIYSQNKAVLLRLKREMEDYGCPPVFPAVEEEAPPEEEDNEPVIKVATVLKFGKSELFQSKIH